MTTNEKEAIVDYLEFHLLTFIERFERHVQDPLVVQAMYEEGYSILTDVEISVDHLVTKK